MLDFSNAEEQRDFGNGPVPAGSVVVVTMTVLEPAMNRQAPDNRFISVAHSGLRQIYCQFEVNRGTYKGVNFRQNITLPCAAQDISLSSKQEQACNIGNSMLKAMCIAANKPTKVRDVQDLSGLRFPVRVKINPKPREKDGREYWNNEIAFVITPDRKDYETVRRDGEIITNGPVSCKSAPARQTRSEDPFEDRESASAESCDYDTVPF